MRKRPLPRPSGRVGRQSGSAVCSIPHRACDEDLVGIVPNPNVHVSLRLPDDEDDPMQAGPAALVAELVHPDDAVPHALDVSPR